jgi:hypothetical protein
MGDSKENWIRFVKANHENLKDVPLDIIDYEICLEAVKKNAFALKYVHSI